MEGKWKFESPSGVISNDAATAPKKMAYISPWKSIPEDQREKQFNAMRGALITAGIMENSK